MLTFIQNEKTEFLRENQWGNINKNYPSRVRAKLLSVFKEGIGHLSKPRLYRKNRTSGHLTVRSMF